MDHPDSRGRRTLCRLRCALLAVAWLPLAAPAQYSYLMLPGTTFQPAVDGSVHQSMGKGCVALTSAPSWGATLVHKLPLRSGARLDAIRFFHYDATPTGKIYGGYIAYNGADTYRHGTIGESVDGTGYDSFWFPSTSRIDPFGWAGQLEVDITAANTDLRLCGVRIRYFEPELFDSGFENPPSSLPEDESFFVAGHDFHPIEGTTQVLDEGRGCIRTATQSGLDADLLLPDGARPWVTEVYFSVSHSTASIRARIMAFDGAGDETSIFDQETSKGGALNVDRSQSFTTWDPVPIDRRYRSYVIRVNAHPDARLCGVRVQYEMPQ